MTQIDSHRQKVLGGGRMVSMTEQGYKGGLVSKFRDPEGTKYMISTCQEIGHDYWTIGLISYIFFGMIPNGLKPMLVFVRNNKEDAHEIHAELKEIVTKYPKSEWPALLPRALPPEGLTKDAQEKLRG